MYCKHFKELMFVKNSEWFFSYPTLNMPLCPCHCVQNRKEFLIFTSKTWLEDILVARSSLLKWNLGLYQTMSTCMPQILNIFKTLQARRVCQYASKQQNTHVHTNFKTGGWSIVCTGNANNPESEKFLSLLTRASIVYPYLPRQNNICWKKC